MKMPDTNQSPHDFWEELYQSRSPDSSGNPSSILQKYVTGRPAGIALELGCGKGDDAVWLAKQNWQVTALDISPTALTYAKANAARNNVVDQITFEQHDLAKTFPDIACDLVTAMFLQTPLDFPQAKVLNRAASCLRPGGLLLIATHASVPPSTWNKPDKKVPTARENFNDFNLEPSQWREIFVGLSERKTTAPDGSDGKHSDNIIALERR